MAERRMFAKTIIDSDFFLDMPMSARLLYYDLGMRADDDGFVNSPKKIMKMCGNADNDLSILVAKRFIILFQTGIIVIKHWKLNNYLRADRYRETSYLNEKSQLEIKENGAYKTIDSAVITCLPDGIPVVDAGKVSIGKLSKGKDSINTSSETLQTSIKPKRTEDYKTIINYLNEKAGTKYKHTSQKTQDAINARFNDGFVLEDFKIVIDNKVACWLNDNQYFKYLRPETLFSNKFEGYLNEKQNPKPKEPQTTQQLLRGIVKNGG